MSVDEMRILSWVSENIRVATNDEKMRESRLRWFDYVQRRAVNTLVGKGDLMQVVRMKRGRGTTKITLVEVEKRHAIQGSNKEYVFGYDRMVRENTCGRLRLLCWGSVTNHKVLELRICSSCC